MAYAGTRRLHNRLTKIEAQRRALNRGAIYSVNQDGLIIARPRRSGMRRPMHLVFLALVAVLLFKAVMFATMGASTYTARVQSLSEGTVVERVGAWAMQADGVTIWLAQQGKMLLN